jgi:hypothetical protein
MRAGNGKGLQPSTRELFSRPPDGFGTTRIHTNRGHSGLGPNKCQSLQTGRSGVLRAYVPLPWSQPFPWSRRPRSHVPMFPCRGRELAVGGAVRGGGLAGECQCCACCCGPVGLILAPWLPFWIVSYGYNPQLSPVCRSVSCSLSSP